MLDFRIAIHNFKIALKFDQFISSFLSNLFMIVLINYGMRGQFAGFTDCNFQF